MASPSTGIIHPATLMSPCPDISPKYSKISPHLCYHPSNNPPPTSDQTTERLSNSHSQMMRRPSSRQQEKPEFGNWSARFYLTHVPSTALSSPHSVPSARCSPPRLSTQPPSPPISSHISARTQMPLSDTMPVAWFYTSTVTRATYLSQRPDPALEDTSSYPPLTRKPKPSPPYRPLPHP